MAPVAETPEQCHDILHPGVLPDRLHASDHGERSFSPLCTGRLVHEQLFCAGLQSRPREVGQGRTHKTQTIRRKLHLLSTWWQRPKAVLGLYWEPVGSLQSQMLREASGEGVGLVIMGGVSVWWCIETGPDS